MQNKTTKETVENIVWKCCDTLRGSMDSSIYKDYILSMLFVKYLSDFAKEKIKELEEKSKGNKDKLERDLDRMYYKIKKEASFDYLVEKREEANIGEIINMALRKIERENPLKFDGIFNNIDFNDSNKFGETRVRNAVGNVIKEKKEENPAFFEKLSEKIKRIIEDYENKRITKEEKFNLSKNIMSSAIGRNEEENLKYDESIRYNKCAKSVYDNSEKYIKDEKMLIDFSLFVDDLFRNISKKPDWQNSENIRNDIEGKIDDELCDLETEGKIEKIGKEEFKVFLKTLLGIGLSLYSKS